MTKLNNQLATDNPLFAYFLIALPANRRTKISKYNAYLVAVPRRLTALFIHTKNKRKLRVVSAQLQLSFMTPQRPKVVRFLPRSNQLYLDYSVGSVFSGVPELRDIGHKIADHPYRCFLLGQLIQMTEEDVLRTFPFVDDVHLDLMKRHLGLAQLSFGTFVPDSWYGPGIPKLHLG